MVNEFELWFKQAERDLKAVENSYRSGDWYVCVFLCHQAVEKALKALLIKYGRIARGHNLIELGREIERELGISIDIIKDDLRKLNPHYTISRYPNAANGLPYELYDNKDAEEALKRAKKVIEWVKQYLL